MTATTLEPIVTELPSPPTAPAEPRRPLASLWHDSRVFASRNVEHIRQIPEKLLDVTLQPLMFVLLFAYVFGNAISVPGGSYREYIIAGILIQSLTFGLVGPATSIATDLQEGVIDRFRALPTTRAAYLFGHFLAELGGLLLSIVILLGAGSIVGWRLHADVWHVATAGLLLVLFSSAMVWIGTWVGLIVRAPDAAMGIAFTVVFPITFLSTAFVPVNSLPTVLQWVASWNPISVLTAATRELFGNPVGPLTKHTWPLEHPVIAAFIYCGLLLAIAIPMSLRALSRPHDRLTHRPRELRRSRPQPPDRAARR
jgi:ABC-2 type transport system permease protein